MSKRKIMAWVSCVNDFATDVPDLVVINFTPDLMKQIKAHQAVVQNHDLLKVGSFCYEADWHVLPIDLDEDCPPDELLSAISDHTYRAVDIPTLVVYDDRIHFEAAPKHGSASEALVSKAILIKDIEAGGSLVVGY